MLPKEPVTTVGERSIKWLHKRYGSNLVAILEHQDEQNPHLHWYCIEPKGARRETAA